MPTRADSSPFVYRPTPHGVRQLHCEGLPLEAVAASLGTPTYVYSRSDLLGRAAAIIRAARDLGGPFAVCYALKANQNLALLRLLAAAGLGADVTSGGELFLALKAGFPGSRILYSGVGKRPAEIAAALEANIRAFHVESAGELDAIARLAAERQQVAPVALRLNPDVAVDTHPHISTGRPAHKFGVALEIAPTLWSRAHEHPWLEPVGLAAHIGSQITRLEPFASLAHLLVAQADRLQAHGGRPRYLDVGGGLGIDYTNEPVPGPADWVQAAGAPIAAAGLELVLEPGRAIVGPAGCLLTRVLYRKEQGDKTFLVVDAGMSHFLRPALYQARHPIRPLQAPTPGDTPLPVDVVGPVCETADTLARAYALPPLNPGALLAITHAGAYGFSMSSNYNGQLLPAEALVDGDTFRVIRERQSLVDLLPVVPVDDEA